MRAGEVVDGRFEIRAVAGRGGMAVVYRALDRNSGNEVALKVLPAEGDLLEARFDREGRMLRDLDHPAIVRWITQGQTPGGMRYIAMEWLAGEILSDRLGRRALSVADAIALAACAAEGLGAAHDRGIVHRDVKPSNLLLVGGDPARTKILDFGIARPSAALDLTLTGANPGTPAYMSPEQARGERTVDGRADVFSLGCVLFRCLAGRTPFVGDDAMAVLAKLVFEEAPRLRELRRDVHRDLDDLVARMLSKDPTERPADGHAVARALGSLGTGADVGPALETTPRARQRIGSAEQRLLSVVLAGQGLSTGADASLVTLSDEGLDRLEPARQLAAARFGARAETIPGGSLVVTLHGAGAATDLAARAGSCALAIREMLPDLPVSIATGRGVLGGLLPVGEVIDRAVGALRAGRGDVTGPIRLDEVTAGLLDSRFEVVGDAEGLGLRGLRPEGAGPRTLLGRPTPFAGRERERDLVLGLVKDGIAGGGASVVLVTGDAGSGKSRLRAEVIAQLRERAPTAEIWFARGDALRAGSAFGLLAEAVRAAAGIRDGEAAEVAWRKVRARVRRDVADPDADRVAAFLGELAGVRDPQEPDAALRAARADPVLMGDQMQRAFVDLVERIAKDRPLVLVLEDLQWADRSSLRFVEATLRFLRDRPICVLAISRSGSAGSESRPFGRVAGEIGLGELPGRACEEIVRSVLGQDADAGLVARIVEGAEGNPLALEELVRSEAQGRAGASPGTVLAMVQTRLEALGADERRALRAASVYGRTFSCAGVAAVTGASEGEVRARLDALADQEVVARDEAGSDGWRFRHSLGGEAAYAMLTEEDRALGHRLAGEFLEAKPDAEPAVLAGHFDRAGHPALAAPHFLRAARKALLGNEMHHAIEWAERAGSGGEPLGVVRLLQAEAHRWAAQFTPAGECAQEALSLLPAGSDDWYRAAEEFGQTCHARGDADGIERVAAAILEPALHEASGARMLAAGRVAAHLLLAGRFGTAARLFDWIDRVADGRALDPAVAARVHTARATRAHFDGDPARMLDLLLRAASCHEEAGDLRGACAARVNAGFAGLEVGAYEQASGLLHTVLEIAERSGLAQVTTYAQHNLGLALARLGDVAEGIRIERLAVEGARRQSHVRLEGTSRTYLATLLALTGAFDEAEREANLAVELLAAAPPARCFALATLADVRIAGGRAPEALSVAKQAFALMESLGRLDEGEALVRLVHAQALAASGDAAGAEAALATARARLRERAARIEDVEMRESFLRVPENERTLRG